jgi:predicted RNA-binding Zn ribbon-like protein
MMAEIRIRKGGLQTAKGFLFELTGGDVSLDFANTVDVRPTQNPKELIPAYEELASWGRQTGLLDSVEEAALRKMAKQHPDKAEIVRKAAIEARECMFQIFSCLAEDRDVPMYILNEWNRLVRRSMAHYEMVRNQEGLSWRLRTEALDLHSLIWPVVHSAVQLLSGPNASRIRKCAGSNCNWIFLDTSKRGNRRWCDMTVCGNRAKARRFYSRKRVK